MASDNVDEPEMRLVADDPEGESVAASLRLKEEGDCDATDKGAPNSGDHVSEFEKWVSEGASKAVAWQTLELANWTTNLPKLEVLSDGSIFSSGDITKRDVFTMEFEFPEGLESMSALRLEVLPDERLPAGGPGRCYYEGRKGDFFVSELSVMIDGKRLEFGEGSVSHGSISVGSGTSEAKNVLDGDGSTGWSTSKQPGKANQMVLNLTQPVKGKKIQIEMIFERHFAASLGRFRFDVASVDRAVEAKRISSTMEALLSQIEEASAADLWALKKAYLYSAESLKEMRAPLESLANQRPSPVTTLVMEERPADNPRLTYRRHRGEYLQPRERIEPHLPEIFGVSDAEMPRDRLALARWLVSPSNPLGARVTVNRVWQSLFGRGLVATSEDFGMQGDLPSHPALLDWLAVEFMDQGWSLKKLLRNIVSSSTYQQSAVVSWEQREADPDNRRLSRGPRKRMSAELVRDSMLASSGLLNREIGGESVYPPQPASVTQGAYGGDDGTCRRGGSISSFALHACEACGPVCGLHHV